MLICLKQELVMKLNIEQLEIEKKIVLNLNRIDIYHKFLE